MPLTDDGWLDTLDDPKTRRPKPRRRHDPSGLHVYTYPDNTVFELGWDG